MKEGQSWMIVTRDVNEQSQVGLTKLELELKSKVTWLEFGITP